MILLGEVAEVRRALAGVEFIDENGSCGCASANLRKNSGAAQNLSRGIRLGSSRTRQRLRRCYSNIGPEPVRGNGKL
jgi:hypothetical protein